MATCEDNEDLLETDDYYAWLGLSKDVSVYPHRCSLETFDLRA